MYLYRPCMFVSEKMAVQQFPARTRQPPGWFASHLNLFWLRQAGIRRAGAGGDTKAKALGTGSEGRIRFLCLGNVYVCFDKGTVFIWGPSGLHFKDLRGQGTLSWVVSKGNHRQHSSIFRVHPYLAHSETSPRCLMFIRRNVGNPVVSNYSRTW